MQVDISGKFLKWKALDRWENEGGSVSDDPIELMNMSSPGNMPAESNSSGIRRRANVVEQEQIVRTPHPSKRR